MNEDELKLMAYALSVVIHLTESHCGKNDCYYVLCPYCFSEYYWKAPIHSNNCLITRLKRTLGKYGYNYEPYKFWDYKKAENADISNPCKSSEEGE